MNKEFIDVITLLANSATAVGVFLAALQIRFSNKQSITNFEDAFAKEYRELASKLPTKAFLGEPLNCEEYLEHFDEMYHYFDLCNEQAFLHQIGRVSKQTWKFWLDGMSSNMRRPAFAKAWQEISSRSGGDFKELRELFPN